MKTLKKTILLYNNISDDIYTLFLNVLVRGKTLINFDIRENVKKNKYPQLIICIYICCK